MKNQKCVICGEGKYIEAIVHFDGLDIDGWKCDCCDDRCFKFGEYQRHSDYTLIMETLKLYNSELNWEDNWDENWEDYEAWRFLAAIIMEDGKNYPRVLMEH
jgi:hypothetical protein